MRLKRALQEAQLTAAKTVSNFDWDHVPKLNPAPLMQLATDTGWLERAENCLIFGPSGVGKTHLAAALARAVVELGKRAKFFTATALVQQLQQAKLQLQLPTLLKKLDRFDLLVVDDLGYVKKSEAETSVLFELIAHRYERRSLLITANQPFSQWDTIFADDMMTVAAVDRLVHHALIIEIVRAGTAHDLSSTTPPLGPPQFNKRHSNAPSSMVRSSPTDCHGGRTC
jgi:DNA replication protein DnaC